MFVPRVNLFWALLTNITSGPEMLNYRQLKDSLESKSVVDVRPKLKVPFPPLVEKNQIIINRINDEGGFFVI